MKRSFSLGAQSTWPLVMAGTGLVAATYGLVRLAYGLLLPAVQADLELTVSAAGFISGGASVLYCVGAVAGFFVADRHPRMLIVASAASAAVGATGMAMAADATIFGGFAIAGSAGAGLASPALVVLLQRNLAGSEGARAQMIVNAGSGPGLVGAGVLALILLPDWRLAWVLAAALTVLAAGFVLVADRARTGVESPRRAWPPSTWFSKHRSVLLAALMMGFGSAAIWTYGRTFLIESGAQETVSVLAWIALGVGGGAVILTARWMDGLGPRVAWTATAGAVAASTGALIVAPVSAPLVLVVCAAFGWAYTAGTGALIAWTLRIDPDRAASGTALLFVTFVLGQAIGSSVIGVVAANGGYAAAFLVAATVSAVAAVPALADSTSTATRLAA